MKFYEFGIWNNAYKVVKKDLKNRKDFDNVWLKEVLGKDIILFAET